MWPSLFLSRGESTQGHCWSKQTLTSATICHHNGNDNDNNDNNNNNNNDNSKGNNTQKTKLVTLAFLRASSFFAKSLNLLLFSSSSSKSDIPLNIGTERLTNNRVDSSMGPPLLARFFAAPNKSKEKISAWWSSAWHGPRFKSCYLKTFSGESKQMVIKHY